MAMPQLDTQVVYAIQGYHQEHVVYLQRAVFAEAEARMLRDQLHQEQMNSSSTIQGLNDEITNLQRRLQELQNGSNSEE